jgi:hypothetical protein
MASFVPTISLGSRCVMAYRHKTYGFFKTCPAPIFARASTIPERVRMAPSHLFAAAFINIARSSSDIFTVTDSVRFPAISKHRHRQSFVRQGI